MEATAQQKMEAWMQVARLCEQAVKVLANVNEGPGAQAVLDSMEDRARTQADLWNEGGE